MQCIRHKLNGFDTAVPESEVAEDTLAEEEDDAFCRVPAY